MPEIPLLWNSKTCSTASVIFPFVWRNTGNENNSHRQGVKKSCSTALSVL